MTYIEDVKKAELEMKKQFNMLRLEDISDAERNFHNAFLKKLGNKTFDDYLKLLDEKESQGRMHLNHIDDFIKVLTENNDPTIQSHNEKIELLNFELEGKMESLSKLPAEIVDTQKKLEAANKKLMVDSDKYAKRIKSLQDSFNKEKANIILETNKMIDGFRNQADREAQKRSELLEQQKEINESIQDVKEQIEKLEKNKLEFKDDKDTLADLDMAIAAKKPYLERYEAELLKVNRTLKNTESLMDDIGKVQKEMNNQCKQKIAEAEEKFKASVALENENFGKLSENVNTLKAKCDALFDQEKKLNQEKNGIEASIAGEKKAIVDYATGIATQQVSEADDGIKEAKQYKKIVEKTTNENPIRNAQTISKGLQEVTNIYRNYHSSYNWFQRIFRFPGTNAARDYALFSQTRSMYMQFSGIKRKEIDTYLDKKQLTGDLKNFCEQAKVSPEEKTNTIIDKDFNAKKGADLTEYARKTRELFYKSFEITSKDTEIIGTMYLNIDRGLRMLNALGDARRKSGNPEVEKTITEISKVLKQFANERSSTIELEIENALLPKEQRKEIPLDIPEKQMKSYLNAKASMEQKMLEEENVILDSIPKTIEIEKELVDDSSTEVNGFDPLETQNQAKEMKL